MRGVLRPGPKFLAVCSNLNARRLSVRTKAPGSIHHFECEVFVSGNQSLWRYFPVLLRGVSRPEPKFLVMFSSLNARRFAARTKIPGDVFQFDCEAFFGQDRNSWRYLPMRMRGVCRSEPKPPAVFSNLNARCPSVRTEIPSSCSQFKCMVFVGQNQNPWQ